MEYLIELLSEPEKASLVMQSLANYIIYFYPGILSIYLYNFFEAKTTNSTQGLIFKSFAISYIYNIVVRGIGLKINIVQNVIAYNFILIIMAGILPYVWHKFRKSKCLAFICKLFKISTSTTGVPFELLIDKDEEYTCLKIYLKDEPYVYIGYMGGYEYDAAIKYLLITGFKKYLITKERTEELLVDYDAEEDHEKVFIKFDDIKIVEKISEDKAKNIIYGKISDLTQDTLQTGKESC